MKIIITEEQFKLLQETDNDFNKTKTLVTGMWADGMEIKDIVMFTSLSYEQVLFLLKDSDMEIDCEGAEEIIKMISRLLSDESKLYLGQLELRCIDEFGQLIEMKKMTIADKLLYICTEIDFINLISVMLEMRAEANNIATTKTDDIKKKLLTIQVGNQSST